MRLIFILRAHSFICWGVRDRYVVECDRFMMSGRLRWGYVWDGARNRTS